MAKRIPNRRKVVYTPLKEVYPHKYQIRYKSPAVRDEVLALCGTYFYVDADGFLWGSEPPTILTTNKRLSTHLQTEAFEIVAQKKAPPTPQPRKPRSKAKPKPKKESAVESDESGESVEKSEE